MQWRPQRFRGFKLPVDSTLATLTKTRKPPRIGSKNKETGAFALDGKKVFAVSPVFSWVDGSSVSAVGGGVIITVYEQWNPNWFVTPSIFVTAKFFAPLIPFNNTVFTSTIFAGGAGILFKQRLIRSERLLFNLGLSLECLVGIEGKLEIYKDDYSHTSYFYIALVGMGVQGGLAWRFTPNISLDINGIVKFALDSRYASRAFAGGVELGFTLMLPY